MEFDRNQFLTDVFEEILSRPGDPVRQIDHAIARVIDRATVALSRLAQAERENLLTTPTCRSRPCGTTRARTTIVEPQTQATSSGLG
jgi:hypothetical protein